MAKRLPQPRTTARRSIPLPRDHFERVNRASQETREMQILFRTWDYQPPDTKPRVILNEDGSGHVEYLRPDEEYKYAQILPGILESTFTPSQEYANRVNNLEMNEKEQEEYDKFMESLDRKKEKKENKKGKKKEKPPAKKAKILRDCDDYVSKLK